MMFKSFFTIIFESLLRQGRPAIQMTLLIVDPLVYQRSRVRKTQTLLWKWNARFTFIFVFFCIPSAD